MNLSDLAPPATLTAALVLFLWADLKVFARGREPSFKEGLVWSIGWLVVGLLAALVIWVIYGEDDAVLYTTVFLVERSLSLDNLFVFLLLFTYFGVPVAERSKAVFWGIMMALFLRGLAIVAGVALIERFHFAIYVLGATLLLLAYRVFRGVDAAVEPGNNVLVRVVRKLFPVTDEYQGGRWFVRRQGRVHVTPLFLCLMAIVFADIAFAIDSIPAAFAITRDPFLIWMGNVFALLGLRALFVLVEGMLKRFRYLNQTIAIVLAVIGVKLMLEDVYELPPEASLGIVVCLLAAGIFTSMLADRRELRAARDSR